MRVFRAGRVDMIELLVYAVGILLSFFMALALGMNDAANPTECAVGAGTISMKKAVILFAIFAGLGGVLLGPFVMKTVDRGLIARDNMEQLTQTLGMNEAQVVEMMIVGSFTAILSAVLWVMFSTWRGMPVSTTHSTIGGVLGFGLVALPQFINWDKFNMVVLSIVISPVLSLLLASGLYYFFRGYFRRVKSAQRVALIIYLLIYLLSFGTSFTIFGKALDWGGVETLVGSSLASLVLTIGAGYTFKKMYGKIEVAHALSYLLVIALVFSAFAFGANDMANATAVFATPTQMLGGMTTTEVMFLLALLGAAGIAIGGFTWGRRVIMTSAYKVTRLDPLSGAAAEYSNALTVFLFTIVPVYLIGFGLPISTTHSSIGSIMGVGLAMRGLRGVNRATTGKILAFWVLTIPAVALISMTLFWLFSQGMVMT